MKIDYFTIPEIQVTYRDNVPVSERLSITKPDDVLEIFKVAFEDCMQHHEEMYAVFVNRRNKVLGVSNISKGGVAGTVADFKIILQIALKAHASGIILSHNHPSGSLKPSRQDEILTSNLKKACEVIGISLLDHVIITQEDYYSFANEGLI